MVMDIFHRLGIKIDATVVYPLDMLSHLERKVDYLFESRDHIAKKHMKELTDKEKKLDANRKVLKLIKKRKEEEILLEKRANKNEDKMKRHASSKAFTGRKQVCRSKKVAKEDANKIKEVLDQEMLDFNRYVGSP
jgi:primosomal protein N'